ncbi:PE family protein [Mycobacterium vicinigordonae]|uniref:PE family protein n=1 Tax=Mycobacterium vicinigordonae TaxID=1719132 RepID=A0A7D6DVC3_9MYCO|nr:PE family protein [Mycobacterium vicinigordonae]QLL05568.1 PE family protein [Mycobacterium vicinigordonae]
MSHVSVTPETVASAASTLADLGSAVHAANAAAASPTTALSAAGADEVSAAVVAVFNGHGQRYCSLSTEATAFHEQFVRLLNSGATSYGGAEAANASLVGTLDLLGGPGNP